MYILKHSTFLFKSFFFVISILFSVMCLPSIYISWILADRRYSDPDCEIREVIGVTFLVVLLLGNIIYYMMKSKMYEKKSFLKF